MKSKFGVVLSDLHIGSDLSPLPFDFKTKKGLTIEGAPWQQELTGAFLELAKEWYQPDILIVLGDAVDGKQRKKSGVGIWSALLEDQCNASVQLIRAYQAKTHVVLRGSDYHVDNNGDPVEEQLAKDLDAAKAGDGEYRSALKFILEAGDMRLHFAHHVPTSQTEWFLSTPGAKEGIRLQLQWRRLGHIDALFRGHNHYWWYQQGKSQHIIQCPSWQLPTDWMHRRSAEPLVDIGAVRFRITDSPDDMGEAFRVQKQLFTIEEAKTKRLKLAFK
jgi:hypothetical protein